jgi:RNA polymerase sigma factor (TIGR02999 family)
MNSLRNGEIAELLAAARQGQQAAVAQLCQFLYQDLRQIARARLRAHQPVTLLDTTALVHESFLRLAKLGRVEINDRNHFLGYAARVMRSVIVDFVRARQAERRGGDQLQVTLSTDIAGSVAATEDDVLRISEALDELARVDARAVQVVEMRYFAGMSEKEIAEALGVTDRTVRRDWEKAKLLLRVALEVP